MCADNLSVFRSLASKAGCASEHGAYWGCYHTPHPNAERHVLQLGWHTIKQVEVGLDPAASPLEKLISPEQGEIVE